MLQHEFLVYDLETNGLLKEVSKVHCVGSQLSESPKASLEVGCQDFLTKLMEYPLAGHNIIGYDHPVLEKLYQVEFNPISLDTYILSKLLYPTIYLSQKDHAFRRKHGELSLPGKLIGSHSLAAWGYRLKENKGDYGETTDWSTYDDAMGEYCRQDVAVTTKLLKHFQKKFTHIPDAAIKLEHDFALLMSRQETNGWHFNVEAAVELYATLSQQRLELEESLDKMHTGWWTETKTPEYYEITLDGTQIRATTKGECTKAAKELVAKKYTLKYINKNIIPGPLKMRHTPFNPGSRDQIAKIFMDKYSWKPLVFTPAGKPAIDEAVLKTLVYPEAKELSKYYENKKNIGMLAEGNMAWLKRVDTITHRIHGRVDSLGARTRRCTHKSPNMAQVPAHTQLGAQCRSLFGVPVGYKLVGCDASGLELRLLAHYLHQFDKGAYAHLVMDGDAHTANQHAAGLATRDEAKTFIYAFIYGGGDELIGKIAGGGAKKGKALKKSFLEATPALKKLIAKIKAEWKASKGWINSLDGVPLYCPSEHACLNTVLQSAGAIIMKRACVIYAERLRDELLNADVLSVGNIHDEFQEQVKDTAGLPEKIGKMMAASIKEAGNYYTLNIPMDGEYKIGNNWAETH